jgi:hypothetical protein
LAAVMLKEKMEAPASDVAQEKDYSFKHSEHRGYEHNNNRSYGHNDNRDAHGYRGKKR